ncbi:hypothetical protein Sf12_gp19 [Shigella phage Sf12]|uniref:Uncharacterized protein n=1 Tax=Shigella phage Sf12 TaxID=2024315 RepID=A0A291AXK8_9CAUD|nr:hypothetical protein HOR99_gp18 [Shigella phage Sf12]ATE85745.1 hypothetical protein Sf12_gp19 [Shigella phage Sf12]
MTEKLKAFYKAYSAWLDAGATKNRPFDRSRGLCYSLEQFSDYDDYALLKEMQQQFTDAGLNWEHPFDRCLSAYKVDANKHLNPARVAWVRKHAEIK